MVALIASKQIGATAAAKCRCSDEHGNAGPNFDHLLAGLADPAPPLCCRAPVGQLRFCENYASWKIIAGATPEPRGIAPVGV